MWQALNPIAGKKSLLTSESQWSSDGQPRSYAEPEVRFGEDRLYFVEITDKREPIEFLRGTSFSFHLVSN